MATQMSLQLLYLTCQLLQKWNRRRVDDRVNRVQSQPVDVIIAQPHERVIAKETADFVAIRPVEVERISPRRVMARGKVRTEHGQVIATRSEMVVDDIEQYGEPALVAGVD